MNSFARDFLIARIKSPAAPPRRCNARGKTQNANGRSGRKNGQTVFPDTPILAFFDFLAFFRFPNDLACFCVFLLFVQGSLGVSAKRKTLAMLGKNLG